MKLVYTAQVKDSADQSDTGIATSQDVASPPTPPTSGSGRYVLDLSKTAFNPATGRNDIVIGGGFKAAGTNATMFGSQDIDALVYNGKPRVRIHYHGSNDSNKSINLQPAFSVGPGETVHVKGTWLFESPVPFYPAMRKWFYLLRGDAESTFVPTTHGAKIDTLGTLNLTTDSPEFWESGTGTRLKKYDLAPAPLMVYGQEIDLEVWMRMQTAGFTPDGGIVVKVNGSETFRMNTGLMPVKTPNAIKGGPIKPLTLHKFGQQAQGEPQTIITDEWRYVSDIVIEKVTALP